MTDALDYLKDELATLADDGLLLHPRTLEGLTGARARFDGRDVINLASNNYLGLASHPRMNRRPPTRRCGSAPARGAVRTIAGQMTLHLRAGGAVRGLQARGVRADVPVGVHGERGHGGGDPRRRRT